MRTRLALGLLASCTSSGANGGGGGEPPLGGANTVTGTVVDFLSSNPVSGAADVTALGLPDAMVATSGASFTITDVPDNSLFQLLATVPTYAPTYSPAMTVAVG